MKGSCVSCNPYATRPRVAFVTMGCAKNDVDTARMKEAVQKAGMLAVDDTDRADAIVLNTCAFIQEAVEENIDAILDIAESANCAREDGRRAKLVAAGCMPARYGKDLQEALPEVDAFVPCSQEAGLPDILCELLGIAGLAPCNLPDGFCADGAPSAYVKISDGCNRFCSFCTIPYIRGRYRSFAYEDILSRASAAVANGARELVLIAQDTGIWGSDFDEPETLASLLDRLSAAFPAVWIRVLYTEPEGVTDELLHTMAMRDNICNYLDIPLQHSDAHILSLMNRRGNAEEFLSLIGRIRSSLPSITLRTTLIAGFPSETDGQFEDLCEFVEEAQFDYVGVFPYSQEEGTRAAELPGQIPHEEKLDRARILREVADRVSSARIASRIGETVTVLVEGRESDGQLFGRAQSQAPEVDGVVFLEEGAVGDFLDVTIDATLFYEMEGTVL